MIMLKMIMMKQNIIYLFMNGLKMIMMKQNVIYLFMNGLKMIMMKMKKKNNERMDKWIDALINIAGKEHLSILYAFLSKIMV